MNLEDSLGFLFAVQNQDLVAKALKDLDALQAVNP